VPKPIATWNPVRDVWETGQACIFGHWAEFSETWPASGTTRRGTALPLPASAHPTADTGCSSLPGLLLPTPTVNNQKESGRRDYRGDMTHALTCSCQNRLLPTPTVSDTNGPGTHGDGGADLRTAVTMLPTPRTVELLPTPRATDGTKGGPNQRGSSGDLMLPSAVMLLPTPTVSDHKASRNETANRRPGAPERHKGMTLTDALVPPTPPSRIGASSSQPSDDKEE
jgi:DNA (cytosine-5)-methyltransferase 1